MSRLTDRLDLTVIFVLLNKWPCPFRIFSQSDYLIQIVDINSHTEWQTMQIQISWLLRSQLIWIFTVCKGRVYPGSAGQGLTVLTGNKGTEQPMHSQSDCDHSCPLRELLDTVKYIKRRKLQSDCTYVQAYYGFHCPHMT